MSRHASTHASASRGMLAFTLTILLGAVSQVSAQQNRGQEAQNLDQQEPRAEGGKLHLLHVQGRVYMLIGAGANITVQVGDEAVVLVDAGLPQMSEEVLTAIRTLSKMPIEFIIDTSIDEDHTGGNPSIAKAGHFDTGQPGEKPGAGIVAQLNVLNRMSDTSGKAASAPSAALPTDTYDGENWALFNDEAIVIFHPLAAHTDGDSFVFFRRSDVISTGDIFVPSSYPVIEADKGGSINGIVDGLNQIIGIMVPRENEEGGTYLIPGHGRVCDRTDIVNYRDAVTIIRGRIQDMIEKGMTLEQVKAAKPTFDYDGIYGADIGPWTTAMFIDALYRDLSKDKHKQKPKPSGAAGGKP
jgi:cyclase